MFRISKFLWWQFSLSPSYTTIIETLLCVLKYKFLILSYEIRKKILTKKLFKKLPVNAKGYFFFKIYHIELNKVKNNLFYVYKKTINFFH